MSRTVRFDILTLFPEIFDGYLGESLVKLAQGRGLVEVYRWNIRDWSPDQKHRKVDDRPFGGGPGMVMRPDVVDAAIAGAGGCGKVVYLSPRGRRLDQAWVRALTAGPGVRLLCGRFEGVDERVLEARAVEEVSLGDFVLSGGEPAAIALLDACVRVLPGVIGAAESLAEESFERGLLEYPHYTRPQDWQGHAVPEALLTGHHEKIHAWRLARAEETTRQRRPDLWDRYAKARGRQG